MKPLQYVISQPVQLSLDIPQGDTHLGC